MKLHNDSAYTLGLLNINVHAFISVQHLLFVI